MPKERKDGERLRRWTAVFVETDEDAAALMVALRMLRNTGVLGCDRIPSLDWENDWELCDCDDCIASGTKGGGHA